ncbi:hypothetical protein [Roseomonas xinghualingensis]|uniref:hypothetical protein n=1 Tax=Roseomonas xinghualingensis TaxID=2986475 RepID=UPI0021F14B85|nr:hypothetical protein [Roseomonas sp. SXEYE001]MCV4208396.1 hypothetical protein [Roseomonas sp. SXEYE001]
MTAFAEAWLLAFLLAATLGAGALVVLSAGILLREVWLVPLRPAFSAAVRTMPILILLALPLFFLAGRLYPWAEPPRTMIAGTASVMILVLWSALGWFLMRARAKWMAGATLLLIVLSGAVGFEDWALSRDLSWAGSLHGIALLTGGATAFLALAILARGEPEDAEARTGLERALLALAIMTLWLWFVQFITVWAADLPPEAAWYLRRQDGFWFWLKAGLILPALLCAIAFAAVPQWNPWRMRLVCALLVIQHPAMLLWMVRPDAPLAPGAALGRPSLLMDAIVIGFLGFLLLLGWRTVKRGGTQPV